MLAVGAIPPTGPSVTFVRPAAIPATWVPWLHVGDAPHGAAEPVPICESKPLGHAPVPPIPSIPSA